MTTVRTPYDTQSIFVELGSEDCELAVRRAIDAEHDWKNSAQPSMSNKLTGDEHLLSNISSYAAEIAVARCLDRAWNTDYTGRNGYDIYPNIEVRSTTPGRNLFIKDREVQPGEYRKHPDSIYVLTYILSMFEIEIVGYTLLSEGLFKAREFNKNGVRGWIIDTHDLVTVGLLNKRHPVR
jgi:hypothetical protein